MKYLTCLTAIVTLTLSGCASTFDRSCAETQSDSITIKYGSGHIIADPATLDVEVNKNFEILLEPGSGYEDKKVRIAGHNYKAAWVKGNGKKSDLDPKKRKIVICTPSNVKVNKEYKYKVKVKDLGYLDPHVKVVE